MVLLGRDGRHPVPLLNTADEAVFIYLSGDFEAINRFNLTPIAAAIGPDGLLKITTAPDELAACARR